MIKLENIHKKYGDNEILKGINLEIKKGEIVAIIGPSGTGKSTLLRCINFLESADAGNITIGDLNIDVKKASKNEINEIRKRTSMVFQNYNLFKNKTAIENVMEALTVVKKIPKEEARKLSEEALVAVGLIEKKDSYPINLSGGQQQRVGIARAMAINPDVILFDEPTSALDPEWVFEVLEVIKNLTKRHLTMIIVTHEMNFAREISDKVVFMEGGNIIAEGSAEEVFDKSKNDRIEKFLKKIGSNK